MSTIHDLADDHEQAHIKLVVSGGADGTVRVWDWATGDAVAVLPFTSNGHGRSRPESRAHAHAERERDTVAEQR